VTIQHICTYFDQNYLLKGLVLLRSLEQHAPDSVVWVLCLDDLTYDLLGQLGFAHVQRIRLSELESWEPRLIPARKDRSLVEYFWTCTPTWIAYVLSQRPPGELVTYVDADLCFYSSTQPIYDELGAKSILIHEHRFPAALEHKLAISGTFNVGLMAFRADKVGWEALRWWQTRCIAACYMRPESGLCGDQTYLNDWPVRFEGVHVLQHVGAGLAPWNVSGYSYATTPTGLLVNAVPLIFFHFHAFLLLSPHVFVQRGYTIPSALRRPIFMGYINRLKTACHEVRGLRPNFRAGFVELRPREFLRHLLCGLVLWG
jgi:hypothetical protein